MSPEPYRSTPVWDEHTLPQALRTRHDTKEGVWAVIRVLEGRLTLTYLEPASEIVLDSENPGLVLPGRPHFVEPLGPVKVRIDFYDCPPGG